MIIITGKWTKGALNKIMGEACGIKNPGSRIGFISREFIGTPYGESTLTGDADTQEELTIDLERMDCFTFIDYIEAMRLSSTFDGFVKNIALIRYQNGEVFFKNRKHFFTDWKEYNGHFVYDATSETGGQSVRHAEKILNVKRDGSPWVRGVASRHRIIDFIPSESTGVNVLDRLQTGDYIGIYSPLAGLDVSHVGIFIRNNGAVYLRHASSAINSVTDQEFMKYISDAPGIVVLRPKKEGTAI